MTADKVKLMMDAILPLALKAHLTWEDLRDMESGKVTANRSKFATARAAEAEARHALVKACGNNARVAIAATEAAKGLLILERKIVKMMEEDAQ